MPGDLPDLAINRDELPDEGFKDVSFGGALTYRPFERWSVSALANYTLLIDDAKDSPIVDDVGDENQFFAGALVNYRF